MRKIEDIEVARKMINLQQSATSRNLEYNLTFETTKRLMSYTRCYYTNVEFNDTTNIFSIDRVDPKKGYIEGNVVACTVEIKKFWASEKVEEKEVEKNETSAIEKQLSTKKKIRKRPIKKSTVKNDTDDDFFEKLN